MRVVRFCSRLTEFELRASSSTLLRTAYTVRVVLVFAGSLIHFRFRVHAVRTNNEGQEQFGLASACRDIRQNDRMDYGVSVPTCGSRNSTHVYMPVCLCVVFSGGGQTTDDHKIDDVMQVPCGDGAGSEETSTNGTTNITLAR